MRRRELPAHRGFRTARLLLFVALMATIAQVLGAVGGAWGAPAARLLDVYLAGALVVAWLLPPGWAVPGVALLGALAATLGLDGVVMATLPLALAAYFGRRLAHSIDVEFRPVQPLVALAAFAGAEMLTRALQWAAYGRAAPTPIGALVVTALAVPVLWTFARLILYQTAR